MKAMILAAGLGTRLLPLTQKIAKPAVPFANRPLIQYCLEWLGKNGVDEVVINLHHQPESIRSAIEKRSWPIRIHFSHEPEILGTAGGVKKAEKYFKDETFFMVNGDSLYEVDLAGPVAYHKKKGALATMVLRERTPEDPYGTVGVDAKGRITGIGGEPVQEANERGYAFTGIHLFEPALFQWIPPGRLFEINQMVYPQLIQKGREVWGFVTKAFWAEVGSHETYLTAHREFLTRHAFGAITETRLSPRVHLNPPALVGSDCQVEDEAQIGPMAVLGSGCHIGTGAVIEDSVLWENATAGPGSHIKGSIIGHGVAVGPGKHLEGMVASGGEWRKIS
ncbi:MAG: NTP transferase domain-containing protein [Proteobacteria bacterium]|nr:NTP transferase domain-containing protein [Pseudomonadota bacterium]